MEPDRRRLSLPLQPGCLADLRMWARSWMTRHPTGADPDSVLLALTELVTNSSKHGAGPVDVSMHRERRQLWLSVTDRSDGLPLQPPTGDELEGGRGVALLEVLATSWGVRLRRPTGKTVWCQFTAAARQPSPE
jgi:anti-sigma regulatory factor (Ser/Thr protein kinase)